jgi:hypothetical protein
MASSFLNAAGTIGRVTINERIEAGRRERRVLARQHKSRDAQDPVPILVTGRLLAQLGHLGVRDRWTCGQDLASESAAVIERVFDH